MDLDTRPELEQLRHDVRAFIASHAPRMKHKQGARSPESIEELDEIRRWIAARYNADYLGADWPVEYGGIGRDLDPFEHAVIAEEFARAGVPHMKLGAHELIAAALLEYGTEDQKRRYLPPIRSMEEIWCQLFSEPNAGSDLAGLETSAVWDGEVWRINGQKVWTTNAHWADFGYLLARTDPAAKKQAGITAFILDMRSPGVEVRPLRELTGHAGFNEVFFTDARVPPESMIGAVNNGWTIAKRTLVQERGDIARRAEITMQEVAEIVALAKELARDDTSAWEHDDVRQAVADLHVRARISQLLGTAAMNRESKGQTTPADALIGKVFRAELNLDIATYALHLQEGSSLLVEGDPHAVSRGRWQDAFLHARAHMIGGGTSEIMRNMLAERVLGLPRDS